MKKLYKLYDQNDFENILDFHNEMRTEGYLYAECSTELSEIIKDVTKISKNYFSLPVEKRILIKRKFAPLLKQQPTVSAPIKRKSLLRRITSLFRANKSQSLAQTIFKPVSHDPNPREIQDIFHPSTWRCQDPAFFPSLQVAYLSIERYSLAYLEQLLQPLQCDFSHVESLIGAPSSTSLRLLKYHYNGSITRETCLRHTDRGFLTLAVCFDHGLFMKRFDTFEWVDVEFNAPVKPCLVLFTGEALARLTGGYFKAIIHKVNTNSDRYSMPYFLRGQDDAMLDTTFLKSEKLNALLATGELERFEPMTVSQVHTIAYDHHMHNNTVPVELGAYKRDKYWSTTDDAADEKGCVVIGDNVVVVEDGNVNK